MKILVLNYEFPPIGGGASTVSYEISKEIAALGHEVDVITMAYKNIPSREIKDGINIIRIPCLRKKKEICKTYEMITFIFSAIWYFRKKQRIQEYNCIHCHFLMPTGIIALLLRKFYKIPYIISAHGSDVPGYNPDRFTFLHKFTVPIIKGITKNATIVTTPSYYLKKLIEKSINTLKIEVIPNGSQDYYSNKYKKEKIILSTGRLVKLKGFNTLIQAFKDCKNYEWHLYIVGDGPEMDELKKTASDNDHIHFTGWISNKGEYYIKLINKASIFALLSKVESQGIVYIEAMSSSCALLSLDIEATKELITEDIGIRSLEENIIQNLKLLILDENRRKEMQMNARRKYLKYFKYSKIVKIYEELLQENCK